MTKTEKRAYDARQYRKHWVKIRAAAKAWRLANLDRKRETDRQYRAAHQDRRKELEAQYRERHRLKIQARRFGLTRDDLHAMREAQRNACAICGRTDAKLCVDHDHKSGAVRGLLCSTCNSAIGLMRESPAVLTKAALYLQHHMKDARELA